jgi:hypothetical protein
MTTSLYLANIADAISNISVSGVTVKDKDQIVGDWKSIPNVLYPNPDGWITDFSIRFDTVLQGSSAPATVFYTLNYRFLGVQIGDISVFPVSYSGLVEKIILIINAIIATPSPYSGLVEMKIGNVSLGARTDPAGNNYFGADLAFIISEMQN